jgi:hypothetical protein
MATGRKKRAAEKPSRERRSARPRPVPHALPAGRQERALAAVAKVLERLGHPAAVIGGIAVITWGRARTTADIDAAVWAPLDAVDEVFAQFRRAGFRGRDADTVTFARENFVLLLEHVPTGIPLDVSLAQLDFERQALEQSEPRSFGKVSIPVPSVTALLIYKLLAGRPRDHEDAAALLELGHEIDATRIEQTLAQFDEFLETNRLGDWRRLHREHRA